MMREESAKPTKSGFARRWLSDDYFDLIVWYEPGGSIHGFQLCYDKSGNERALTWTHAGGFNHKSVDSGEQAPTANLSPILAPGGFFQAALVKEQFLKRCTQIDESICKLVLAKLDELASSHKRSA